uniref:Uncharacterized protein n=1 Tax=Chlamydomonas euryale TaxID=1486919 RepID=A0A7R9V759_9CHLO
MCDLTTLGFSRGVAGGRGADGGGGGGAGGAERGGGVDDGVGGGGAKGGSSGMPDGDASAGTPDARTAGVYRALCDRLLWPHQRWHTGAWPTDANATPDPAAWSPSCQHPAPGAGRTAGGILGLPPVLLVRLAEAVVLAGLSRHPIMHALAEDITALLEAFEEPGQGDLDR